MIRMKENYYIKKYYGDFVLLKRAKNKENCKKVLEKVGVYGSNGCGKTTIVMIQGIVGAFFVRIPVAYVMSKIEPVSLFRVGLTTPSSTIVQIVICGVYLFFLSRTLFKKEKTNDAPNHELCDAEA